MKRPNTFIIGAPKSGTTALANYLSHHPNAFLCYPKEPSYWSSDINQKHDNALIESLEDYEALFQNANEENHVVVIDASTRYLMSKKAVQNIISYNAQAKFIIMLRDLVEIAQAFHMEQVFNDNEDIMDFSAAWLNQDERWNTGKIPKNCADPQLIQYRNVVSLGSQLLDVLSIVPRCQVLLVFHEDMQEDTKTTFLSVTRFLGLSDHELEEFPRHGAAHYNRSRWLAKIYQSPHSAIQPFVRGIKRVVRTRLSYRLQERLKHLLIKRGTRPEISQELRASLISELISEINLVSELSKRDLEHWKR